MDQFDTLIQAAKNAQFQVVGPGHYVKYNPLTGVRTTVIFEGKGDVRNMTVRHEQAISVQNSILDLNVARQNDFNGYGDGLYQASSIPLVAFEQVKKKCGFQPGYGMDPVAFKKLLNDRDYYKFKTVPGRV